MSTLLKALAMGLSALAGYGLASVAGLGKLGRAFTCAVVVFAASAAYDRVTAWLRSRKA